MAEATRRTVERCLRNGFALQDIAVVSLRGREGSAILKADRLGPWSVRRFTGAYDGGSNSVWTTGDLLLETVRRFKGQAAPAVVLTECDFEALDPIVKRLLFVGLTRSRVHLEWVLSERGAEAIRAALGTERPEP